jgi:hypothetical protein
MRALATRIFLVFAMSLILSACGGEALTGGVGSAEAGVDTTAAAGDGEIAGGVKDAAISGAGGNVAVDAGYAGNGAVIAIPAGFTAAQCRFTAAPAVIDGRATSIQASINRDTGEVTCEKVVQERPEIPPEFQDCTASFTVICVK